MCAQFLIYKTERDLLNFYGVRMPRIVEQTDYTIRVLPYQQAPIVLAIDGIAAIELANFSLVPAWSKERKVKFATHNARLETQDDCGELVSIYDKPTWKRPFISNHCLVPISSFIEPIYTGEYAGNMIAFKPKDNELLTAAGIWDEWVDKATGEVIKSFAVITHDPPEFVEKIGHDRCPLFLRKDAFESWLNPKTKKPDEIKQLLLEGRVEHELEVAVDRPLAKGWEKRRR